MPLPVKFSAARAIDTPLPPLPAGATADGPVRLQALVDLDGTLQRATYIGGPASLGPAAIDAAGRWRSEPARVNGAPVATGVVVQVRFKAPAAAASERSESSRSEWGWGPTSSKK